MKIYSAIYQSPFGNMGIEIANQKIINLDFLTDNSVDTEIQNNPYAAVVSHELDLYFNNPAHLFSIAFELRGTPFQQSVWKELHNIPLGKTVTYKTIAEKLNTSPRAVGNACRANPIPVIIPCHRVVGQNGLGGFAGDTTGHLISIKKWLLRHESVKQG